MSNNFSESGCIIPSLLILVYGLLIICSVPFSLIWFLPVIFCLITTLLSIDYSSTRVKHYTPIKSKNDQDQHKRRPGVNSNIVRNSVRNDAYTLMVEDFKPLEPIKSKAFYCQFCGTRRDENAKFCYQCGSKLE